MTLSMIAENTIVQTHSRLAQECLHSESRWRNNGKVRKKTLGACMQKVHQYLKFKQTDVRLQMRHLLEAVILKHRVVTWPTSCKRFSMESLFTNYAVV
jgi:hypothetical protein